MTQILNALSNSALVDMLQHGAVGVLPTDTVYGLVCRATDKLAVERLYQIKSRDQKPGTLIAANVDQLTALGIKAKYLKAVKQFWPNAVSIVIPTPDPGLVYLHKGLQSLACRVIKAPPDLLNVLSITGVLLTSSANLPGEKPAGTIEEAQAYFGDKVDFYVNGGDLSGHEPSTLIRIVGDAVDVLRSGAVKIDEMGKIL